MPRGDQGPTTPGATSSRRGLSRRELLAGGAGGLAAATAASLGEPLGASADEIPLSPGGDMRGPSVNGTLKATLPEGLAFQPYYLDLYPSQSGAPLPTGPDLVVKVTKDTELWRTQPVEISEYQPGDKLIAYVRWSGADLIALAVEPLFEAVQATVTARNGDKLTTDVGTVVLNRYTMLLPPGRSPSAKSLAAISKGQKIGANCLHDPSTGEYVAANIAVLAT